MKTYPVTLVTGFLGSGKSSLINRLLRENPRWKIGLVLNEFGEQALESQIIETRKEPIFELSSGCLCCVAPSDLKKALLQLVERDRSIDHIVVEASGLTSPGPILQALTQDEADFPFALSGVFCVIDASQFAESAEQFPHVKRQLNFADAVFLTKTDLVDPAATQAVLRNVEALKPNTRIHRTDRALPWAPLFDTFDRTGESVDLESPRREKPERRFFTSGRHHDAQIFEYETSEPFDAERLGRAFDAMPPSILRAKGTIYLTDKSAARWKYVVQYTGRQKQLYSRAWKPEEPRGSYLLFIGTDFDDEALRAQLDACRVRKEISA